MAALLADGTKQIAISGDQYAEINSVLRSFYQSTKCGVVMLCDTSGLSIAQSGTLDSGTASLLSTLAAGNLAATNEMARLLGEDSGFKVQFHEGDKNNVYVTGVNDDCFITVVFSENNTFGMIRVLTGKLIEELKELLEKPAGEQLAAGSHDQTKENLDNGAFQEELTQRLDSVLSSKD